MPGSLVEFSNELAGAVERTGSFVIAVLEGGRDGVSGTIWREGAAVTAEHTIRGQQQVTVVLPSGEKATAAVAGRDAGTDIAVLRLPVTMPAARIAPDTAGRVGEIVLSVGRRGSDGLAAASGMIGAVGGPWRTWHGARIDRWFRLDLNPFPGFSGGPIVNAAGEVLGMATSGPRRTALTLPAVTVNRVVDQLLERGRVARGYIGVALQPVVLPSDAWKSLGISTDRGLLVVTVASGSAAEKARILLGDVIVAIEGSPVRSLRSLQFELDSDRIGKAVTLDLVRGGKVIQVSVTVDEKP